MKRIALVVALAVLVLAPTAAQAGPLQPRTDMWFTMAGSYSGIPNDAVMVFSGTNITLGLTAHERYFGGIVGQEVTNDGTEFYAAAGTPFGGNLASWNFGFYFNAPSADTMRLSLSGTGFSRTFNWSLVGANPGVIQGSENFGFDWTGLTALGFNANAADVYHVTLTALAGDARLGSTSIDINVVPEPATLSLLGLGLAGIARAARRRKK